jgi:hypothetical protein
LLSALNHEVIVQPKSDAASDRGSSTPSW